MTGLVTKPYWSEVVRYALWGVMGVDEVSLLRDTQSDESLGVKTVIQKLKTA